MKKSEGLKLIRTELKRFDQKLAELEKEVLKIEKETGPGSHYFSATRKSAAAKRAAMDLKIALTSLREFGRWSDR